MSWGKYKYVKQWGVSLNQLMSRRFWGWKYDSGPTEKDAILCEVKRDKVTSPEQREKIEIRNQEDKSIVNPLVYTKRPTSGQLMSRCIQIKEDQVTNKLIHYEQSAHQAKGPGMDSHKSVPGLKVEARALSTEVRHLAPKPPGHPDINKSIRIFNGKSNSNSNPVELNTTSALANYVTKAGLSFLQIK
uniref:Uncharacterized protein n=1 Tax=Timema douglasi TaxID=61478 RepID=A0A7R8VPA6_TIMDO|nr:unnamed protein product [Timema douglasi]